MLFADVNLIAVFVAALAAWMFGAAYYGTMAKPWLAALGKTREEVHDPSGRPKIASLIISFVAELILAYVMAWVIGALSGDLISVGSGLMVGGLMWLGFISTTVSVNYAYACTRPMLTIIDAGHWLGVSLVAGGIIGAFG